MRPLNHVHSIPAASHHEYAFTWFDLCPITRRSDTRRHATGNEAGEIEWDVLIDHDDRGLVHHCAFRKSTDHAKGPDSSTLLVTPAVGAVELRPLSNARTFSAKMMQTLTTPSANPTRRYEG